MHEQAHNMYLVHASSVNAATGAITEYGAQASHPKPQCKAEQSRAEPKLRGAGR